MLNGIKLKTKVLCLIAILGALSPIAAAFTYVSLREQANADELAMNTKSGRPTSSASTVSSMQSLWTRAASICLQIGIAPKNTATEF
jgi:hypothetical protein